jgi:hypothetical protein
VAAILRCGDDINQVFDGARPQQYFPVGLAGMRGKGRGHGEKLRALFLLAAEELGETQVVTHGEPEFSVWGIGHDDRVARFETVRFMIFLAIIQLYVE